MKLAPVSESLHRHHPRPPPLTMVSLPSGWRAHRQSNQHPPSGLGLRPERSAVSGARYCAFPYRAPVSAWAFIFLQQW